MVIGNMLNKLGGANTNADADANNWVSTLALLDYVQQAKN